MALPLVSRDVRLERIIEDLESTFTDVNDFLGLRVLGNVYEKIAEKHRSSDVSRWVVIEWFEQAADTYKAALTAYRSQSTVQIPDFGEYLEQRAADVERLTELLRPYGQRPADAKAAEPVFAGR